MLYLISATRGPLIQRYTQLASVHDLHVFIIATASRIIRGTWSRAVMLGPKKVTQLVSEYAMRPGNVTIQQTCPVNNWYYVM